MLPEPVQAALLVTQTLDTLNIPYFLGGSFASTVHGIVRTTQDADIIVDMQKKHIQSFISSLEKDFYLDEVAIEKAVKQRGSFNILHRQSIFKIDIFLSKNHPFEQAQFSRAKKQNLVSGQEITAYVASAEDILLAKLVWYQQGGEVSERQWRDALGVVKVQGEALDYQYLRQWANTLLIRELFEKIMQEK